MVHSSTAVHFDKRGVICMSDLYRVLGVTRRADGTQIKCAFRKAAKSCHPDLHGGDKRAEQRFKELNLAYEMLGDPTTRALYDGVCAQRAFKARRRFRSAAATMAASFVLTVSTGAFAGVWLFGERLF